MITSHHEQTIGTEFRLNYFMWWTMFLKYIAICYYNSKSTLQWRIQDFSTVGLLYLREVTMHNQLCIANITTFNITIRDMA